MIIFTKEMQKALLQDAKKLEVLLRNKQPIAFYEFEFSEQSSKENHNV